MLTNNFISICKEYAKNSENVLGQELEDNKKVCKYRIIFYSYILEFRYVKKESTFFKASSLYCVLSLSKNSVVHYHLPDIIPFLTHKTFQSCYFWNIENAERLKNCFVSLVSTLDTITHQLETLSWDESIFRESLFNKYRTMFNIKDANLDFSKIDDPREYAQRYFTSLQDIRDGYLFSRYSNFAPYALLLKNKFQKALKKYEKIDNKNKLFPYEKALIDHIRSASNPAFHPFEPGCDVSKAAKVITPASFAKAFTICFALFSVLFCGALAIYNLIISINTLAVLAAPWYVGFLCSALSAIAGTLTLLANKPMPNKHLTEKESREILNTLVSKGTKRFSIIVFAIFVAASIFFTVTFMVSNVRFYENDIRFDRQSYAYDQIDSVYYIDARYNFEGDRIERGSYVILFKDKTSLDLDGYASVNDTEKKALPILESKGYQILHADSERDLPWYTV